MTISSSLAKTSHRPANTGRWAEYSYGTLNFDNIQKLIHNEIPSIRWESFLSLRMLDELIQAGNRQLQDACWTPYVKVAGGATGGSANILAHENFDLFIYFSQVSRAKWQQLQLQRDGYCPYERLKKLLKLKCGLKVNRRASKTFGQYGDYFWLKTSVEGWPPLSIPQVPVKHLASEYQSDLFWICLLDGYSEESDLITYNSMAQPQDKTQRTISHHQLINADLMYQQATPGTLLLLNTHNVTELLPGPERLWIGGHLTLNGQMAQSWT